LKQEGSPSSKILHLTDIHLDLGYKVGSSSDCGKPLCCTNDTEMAETAETAAGYWGSYSCDVPVWTFEDMLVQIREKHLDVSATILSHV
jgi:sphingomyelin phosphodiesterase